MASVVSVTGREFFLPERHGQDPTDGPGIIAAVSNVLNSQLETDSRDWRAMFA